LETGCDQWMGVIDEQDMIREFETEVEIDTEDEME
jgi:hypothetical protein